MTHLRSIPLAVTLSLALCTSCGTNTLQAEVNVERSAVGLARETLEGGYKLLTVAELKKAIDDGEEMLIVDTMPHETSYLKEHIPGAANFPFPIEPMLEWDTEKTEGRTENDFLDLTGDDPERTLVFYCGFVECTRSHQAAVWAKRFGFRQHLPLPGRDPRLEGRRLPRPRGGA